MKIFFRELSQLLVVVMGIVSRNRFVMFLPRLISDEMGHIRMSLHIMAITIERVVKHKRYE